MTRMALFLILLCSCTPLPTTADAGQNGRSDARALDAALADAATADATQLDAAFECIQEHRFSLGGQIDPPGAVAGPSGRVVHNQYGGVGIDDGFVDTGETFTVTWAEPTFLVSYGVSWMEDGPDPDNIWGEHRWEVTAADGTIVTGQGEIYETGQTALVPTARELRVIPVDGDRMAIARIRWCVPVPECRCEDIAPVAP
jgi:hypothetical protein